MFKSNQKSYFRNFFEFFEGTQKFQNNFSPYTVYEILPGFLT